MEDDTIVSVVETVAGSDVLPLVDVLKGKKNVSEFTLAEELKEEINTIRNKLYRLYDSNLVEFTRKKDKKKGWYIYYWTFVPQRIPRLVWEMKKKQLEKLRERLTKEQSGNYFVCKNECMRLTFDQSMDHEFKCPECGELMNQEDNTKRISNMQKELAELEHDVAIEPVMELLHQDSMEFDDEDEKPKVRVPKVKVVIVKAVKEKPSKKASPVKKTNSKKKR